MKTILNFFRSKNKKNILLSFFLAFSIFLSVGVAVLPTKKASAAISGNIYDYVWANYFDFAGVDVSAFPPDTTGLSEFSYAADYSAQTIKCTLREPFDSSYFSFYVDFIASPFDVSLTVTPDVLDDTIYSFFADCYCSFAFDSAQVSLSVGYVNEFTNAVVFPIYDSFRLGSYSYGYDYYDFPSSGASDVSYFLYSIRVDIYSSESLSLGDYVLLSNIGLYKGKTPYSYTDYFYDLTDLPNPLPLPLYPDLVTPDDSESEDSSSDEDSGSDDDSSGGIIPPPEMEGDYLDGYLAGLEYGKYGVFSQCQCYIQLNYQYDYERIKITDDFFIYGGLDLSKFLPLVENKENVLSSFIYFYFPTGSYPVSSELSFSATGITDAFIGNPWSVTFQNTPNSKQLSWSLVSSETLTTDRNIYKSDTLSQSFTGSDIILSFKTPTFSTFDYLSGLTVTVSNNLYELGYSAGLTVNGQDRYDAGYNAGYLKGDNDGYIRGFNKGAGNDPFSIGDFMFTALDMPGRIVYNWLNFDFLGVNLAGLLATLITIGLVGVIFAKLKIF